MDPWRIGLVVMAIIFVAFILFRLRPRMPEQDSDAPPSSANERLTRAEQRLLKRLQRLPADAKKRLLRHLREMVDDDEE